MGNSPQLIKQNMKKQNKSTIPRNRKPRLFENWVHSLAQAKNTYFKQNAAKIDFCIRIICRDLFHQALKLYVLSSGVTFVILNYCLEKRYKK